MAVRAICCFISTWVFLASGHSMCLENAGQRLQCPSPAPDNLSINGVSLATREYWMHYTQQVLEQSAYWPCPLLPFATVIVNHTGSHDLGDLICTGINGVIETGDPTLHGEMAAIQNCTEIMKDPKGRFKMTADEVRATFNDLTLYTNAESCFMCAAAIRLAGFHEYVYGTSLTTIFQHGWTPVKIFSTEVFSRSEAIHPQTNLIGGVLTNETNSNFLWQFDLSGRCPQGCVRSKNGSTCSGLSGL